MSILELKRLTAVDSGEYTCVASNRAGSATDSKQMVVYGTFVILEVYCLPHTHTKHRGASFTLQCRSPISARLITERPIIER